MPTSSEQQKTIAIDFDGVLHSYESGWCGAESIPDEPVPGARAFVGELIDAGYRVVVTSCRARTDTGHASIEQWLKKHHFDYPIEVTDRKPSAAVYIDDRAIQFRGTFPFIEDIDGYRPWTKPYTSLPLLIATVGLPRSGKSSWARGTGYPIVNPDSIRLALHGNAFIPEAEPMVWTMARYMVQSLFLAGNRCVVLDATNTTRSRRAEWVSKKKQWNTRFVFFNASEQECISRCDPANHDLLGAISRMAKQFEPFQQSEVE